MKRPKGFCRCGKAVRSGRRIVYGPNKGGVRKKYIYENVECRECRNNYERKRAKLREPILKTKDRIVFY